MSDLHFLLKGPVSHLLHLSSIGASNAVDAAKQLDTIHSVLTHMPDPELHLTKQLMAYTQHTLNHILQLCQNFMTPEKRFDFLVEAWCRCLGFLLRLPDAYAFIMGTNWRYSQLLLDVLFRALDGLPIRPAQQQLPQQQRGQQQPQQQREAQKSKKPSLDPTALQYSRLPDETRLTALRCLILALPLDKSAPTLNGSLDATSQEKIAAEDGERLFRTETDKEVQDHLLEPASRSTMGQMLVILFNASKDADLVELRRVALEGVMKLLRCIESPDRVSSWFPGLAAGLTEAMLARGLKEHHSVLAMALDIWTYLVVLLLKDEASSTTNLAETAVEGSGFSETLMEMYRDTIKMKNADVTRSSSSGHTSASGYRSDDVWMKKTNHGLKTLFKQLSPLRMHHHWMVRFKFGNMAFYILQNCQKTLIQRASGASQTSGVVLFLLETLIECTQDDYRDVYIPARVHLGQLVQEFKSMELASHAKEVLRQRLMAFPRVLHGADETAKQSALRLAQGLVLFMGRQMESVVNYQTLLTYIQPWINVLTIEQLDQHNMEERGGIFGDSGLPTSGSDMSSEEAHRWRDWVQRHKGSGRKFGFPRRIHLHLREQSTASAFLGFLRQLGSTTEIDLWTEELITRIQKDSRSVRASQGWFDSSTVSCVLMLNQLFLGAHGVGLATLDTGEGDKVEVKKSLQRKRKRHIKRAARGALEEYLAILVECSQMALDAKAREEAHQRSMSTTEREAREKKFALAKLLGMEAEEGYDIEQVEAQIYDYNTDVMLQSILLEGIASLAVVLGSVEFEMELVRVLYILLEHLGDQDSALVRDTAEATLEHVAFICQYESIGELIQANYDYVIQQVSQRIAFLSSNPKTPQVLCALIRVVGSPAVSMLEDSVTEIFAALDHWKSQEDRVGEGLFKSLSEIVKVIASEAAEEPESSPSATERDSGTLMSPRIQFTASTEASKEVADFAKTYRIMVAGVDENDEEAEKLKKETENMTPQQIQDYFMNLAKEAKEEEEKKFGQRDDGNTVDQDVSDDEEDEDSMSFGDLRAKLPKPAKGSQPLPMTKHQALTLRILQKAGYFLTASSPRIRILALETIQGAIVVLKDRPLELNPAIHAFWPSIVGRVLKRSEMEVFYVSLRAIEVVTLLAENCKDFLGRHLLDDIWPFILKALHTWASKRPSPGLGRQAHSRITASLAGGPNSASSKRREPEPVRTQGRREASAKVFTLEHRLQMTTLESVAKIVRKLRIPVKELWEMLLLVREMMLDRYWMLHWDVRLAAQAVIKNMAAAGHGDAVFVALDDILQASLPGVSTAVSEDVVEDDAIKMCRDILLFMDEHNL
ncbi:TEL2-interacting protein 1 [Mortierella claussenii]|nr:TEL2-interacting protein 1 [Mortierella claussenii]